MLDKFLEELAELTKKHGLAIGGCGCCGSPFIFKTSDDREVAERLEYDEKTKKYTHRKKGETW